MPTQQYPVEAIQVTTTPHSTNIVGVPPMSREATVALTMPHNVAKELCLILRKQLLQCEEKQGSEIIIPPEIYQAMGISPEDWKRFVG